MNNKKANNKIINIGNDHDCVKISLIGEKLSQIMRISPLFIERGAPKGSINVRIPDLKLIKELAAYTYEVPLTQGLTNTVEWYKNRYN
jgi:nucleoside-diphosphate-sugar epimerase